MPKPLTNADIGARVKERRVAAGLSQTELGDIAAVSFQTVAGYERGEIAMNAVTLARIAGGLGCMVADLFPPGPPPRPAKVPRGPRTVKRKPGRPLGS